MLTQAGHLKLYYNTFTFWFGNIYLRAGVVGNFSFMFSYIQYLNEFYPHCLDVNKSIKIVLENKVCSIKI